MCRRRKQSARVIKIQFYNCYANVKTLTKSKYLNGLTVWRSLHRSIKPVNAEPIHNGAKANIAKNLPNASSVEDNIKSLIKIPDDVSELELKLVELTSRIFHICEA